MSARSFKECLWMHWKSRKLYMITGFPLREADLIPQVSYRRFDGTGPEFTRTCEEFFDGRYRSYIGDDEEDDAATTAPDWNGEPITMDSTVRWSGMPEHTFSISGIRRDGKVQLLMGGKASDWIGSQACEVVGRTGMEESKPLGEPEIGMDCDKRSIVPGDYVTLYRATAQNRHAWGPNERRKVVAVMHDGVRLEPCGDRDPDCDVWTSEAVKYAGNTPE